MGRKTPVGNEASDKETNSMLEIIEKIGGDKLPDAWRLIYTIKDDKVDILSVILEWLDHKNYERRFGY